MPVFSQKTPETVNISGYRLDNSKLNKLGNLRISPLKSFAILFFIVAFILPQAVSRTSDLSFYFTKFSAVKELAKAAEVPKAEEKNYSADAEQKNTEEPKQKKFTLVDIWPEEANSKKNEPDIISVAQRAPQDAGAVQPQKQTPADIWPKESKTQIVEAGRLVIPAIKVSANIESLGIKQGGEMEAPKNYLEAGWFNLGPRPGESGIALIAGHLNNQYGSPAVFWYLSKLKAGDDIYLADENGRNIHFKVSGSRIYSVNTPLEEIVGGGGAARLNLITCNGVWDKKAQNYTNRLVVSAELVAE